MVISRGQSAAVAESVLSGRVPIVNIGFSPYDILRSRVRTLLPMFGKTKNAILTLELFMASFRLRRMS